MKLKVMARGLWTASCCLFLSCLLLEIPAVISLPSSSGAKHSVTAFSSWAAATKSHHNGNLCKHRISCIRGCHPQFDSGLNRRRRSVVLASMATTHHDETVATNSTSSSSSSSSKSSIPSDDCDCSPTPQSYTDTGSTAIILNMNARSVTPQLISIASNIVGENNVYITKTMEDAVLAARTVVRGCSSHTATTTNCKPDELQKYSLVVPVGGDGTLSGWIDTMVDEILLVNKLEEQDDDDDSEYDHTNTNNMTVEEAVEQLPLVGYIPMGTGNGLGYVIGCKASKDYHDQDSEKKRSILSRIKVNRKKYERAYQVMSRLKEVGDAMQDAEQTNSQDQLDIAEKCTIVEMPLMEVTHPEIDEDSNNIIVEGKGDLCFFAGAGFDSLMLHDFYQIKSWSKSDSSTSRALPTFVKDALSSVTGYCVALVTKTLPQALRYGTHKIHVKVTTTDEDTLWVDHRRGDFSEPAVQQRQKKQLLNGSGSSSGDSSSNSTTTTTKASDDQQQQLIYSGSTGIICAATTPYYGGGMRLFPYARLIPDKLQLRIGRISPLTGFFNIPKIFEGSYRETGETTFGCLDFIGKEFVVEVKSGRYDEYVKRQSEKKKTKRLKLWPWGKKKLDDDDDGQVNEGNIKVKQEGGNKKGFPFQHSGESMGIKERFRLRVVQKPVKFVSFLAPRVIVDD